jgi:hypothetical protein
MLDARRSRKRRRNVLDQAACDLDMGCDQDGEKLAILSIADGLRYQRID